MFFPHRRVVTVPDQLQRLLLGAETTVTEEELASKLQRATAEKRPLRVKLGCDPTAPDLHLGHSVVLAKLRQFQDLGHKAVLIIGDYTAMIGDPSGQNKTRPMLSEVEIEQNARTYLEQAGKILDSSPARLEIRRNSEWLAKMSFADILKLASRKTAAQMLQRRDFKERFQNDVDIALNEFLYPLMQGWDSVVVRADVELGGTDQLFNNLVGRDLQRQEGQEAQVVMILPLLEGLDGAEKMSKSKGNSISLTDPPDEMFGKTMSICDELMWRWWRLLFSKSDKEIAALCREHPMEMKKRLAFSLVERFHGLAAAEAAAAHFDKQFSKRQLSEVAEPLPLNAAEMEVVELVEAAERVRGAGKRHSRSEIRRLLEQGGVTLDGRRLTDPRARVKAQEGQILRVGKRMALRLQPPKN